MLDADLNCVGGEVLSPDAKSLYAYPVSSEDLMLTVLSVLGIKEIRWPDIYLTGVYTEFQ